MGEKSNLTSFKLYSIENGEYHEVGELNEPLPIFEPGSPVDKSSVMTINPTEEITITFHQSWWQRWKMKRAFRKIFGRKVFKELRNPFKVKCSVCGRKFNYKKRGYRVHRSDGTDGYACSDRCLHKC